MLRLMIILMLVNFSLSSCQKEVSPEDGVLNPPVTDSTLIARVVALDTTALAPFDTIYKYLATYDSDKRLKTTLMVEYYGTGTAFDTAWEQVYYYSGGDSLPNRVISKRYSSSIDTSFYSYSTVGAKIVADSNVERSTFPPSPDLYRLVYLYNYSGNTIATTERRYTNNSMDSEDNYRVHLTKQNNNIVYQIDTLETVFQNYIETFSVNYDTRFNPIKNLFINVPYYIFDNGYLLYGSANNVTEITNRRENAFESLTEHYKYVYKYNQLNYPTEASILDMGSSFPSAINKIKYFYTN